MTEDIRVMTSQLAADPTSLVFLPLGEALRRRRQLASAQKVAVAGLSRYPDLADAHDLYARILGDCGDFEVAFDEWGIALRLDPGHAGAHKGIGFLYFVAGELPKAQEHLEQAREVMPDDEGIAAAIARVREGLGEAAGESPAPPVLAQEPVAEPVPDAAETEAELEMPAVFVGFEGAEDGLLLVDAQGRRLGGGLQSPDGLDVADRVAAYLAGVSREASRATKLLEMGAWESLTVQAPDGNFHLVAPTADTILLVARASSVPLGRLAALSVRASEAANQWMESLT
ncbi:MAG: tetratricopeptide repeat protein [Gemmatimonadales bacterium]